MMSDTQREVAVHLLANALRKVRLNEHRAMNSAEPDGVAPARRGNREQCDERYVRGMLDMLSGLYGAAYANELYRTARSLERSASLR
jgi:hypothetical protein